MISWVFHFAILSNLGLKSLISWSHSGEGNCFDYPFLVGNFSSNTSNPLTMWHFTISYLLIVNFDKYKHIRREMGNHLPSDASSFWPSHFFSLQTQPLK